MSELRVTVWKLVRIKGPGEVLRAGSLPPQKADAFSSTVIDAGSERLQLSFVALALDQDVEACCKVLAPVGVINQRIEPSIGMGGGIGGERVSQEACISDE